MLGNLVDIRSGDAPSMFKLGRMGEVPYLKVEDLNNCSKYQIVSRSYCKREKTPIPPNSIVFPKRGAAILNNKVRITSREVYLDSNLMALTPRPEVLDPEYLFYIITYQQLFKIADTSTIPQINNKHIIPLSIALPQLSEQKKIAEILTCWDKAIELVKRLIEEYDKLYRAIARSLLSGTTRVTDEEASGRDTYKTVALSDIFERVTRKNSENCNLALTISGRDGLIRQEEYFKKRVASERLDGYYLLNNGEFAFNRSSMNGYPYGAIKRLDRYDRGVVSTLYLCFKLKDALSCSDYFALYFDSGLFNREIYSIAQEGARSHGLLNIGTEEFFNLRVPLPPLDAQLRIARVIMAFSEHNKNLRVYRDRLIDQKRGLMQKLLTGKIRVKV